MRGGRVGVKRGRAGVGIKWCWAGQGWSYGKRSGCGVKDWEVVESGGMVEGAVVLGCGAGGQVGCHAVHNTV